MDYEEVANISNLHEDITPSQSYQLIIHEIIFSLFCLVGILADGLIIYTIVKFQRLRSVTNGLIVNWAVADIISLFVTPSAYRILSVIEDIPLSVTFYCVIFNLGTILHSSVIMFVTLICFNWMLETYFRKTLEFVQKYHKIAVAIVWLVTLVLGCIYSADCISSLHYGYSHCFLFLVFLNCATVVLVLQASRVLNKCRRRPINNSPLMLNLSTAFLSCWILGYTAYMGIESSTMHYLLVLITECLIFSSSFLNLSLLYSYNVEFRACLNQLFTCSNIKYEESSLNFDNPTVRVHNGHTTVSFNGE